MKKFLLAIVITIFTFYACSQSNKVVTDFNLGFENTTLKQKLPDKWLQWGRDYLLSIDTTVKHGGKNSVLIRPSESAKQGSFGCVAYSIPAEYEAKEIELKAYMKLQDVAKSPIGLMLRIDGSTESIQFDNMMKKGIMGTSDWKQYSVKLPYPAGAKTIYIGAILSGTGQLWVDDFELLLDGKNIETVRQVAATQFKAALDKEFDSESGIHPFEASEQKVKDLKMLGLIWGFLKYYHPGIAAGNFNWDYELFRILPKILGSKSSTERDALLTDWINQLGSFKTEIEPNINLDRIKLEPDLDWITGSGFSHDLTSLLVNVKNAKRTGEHYYVGFTGGAGNALFKNENAYNTPKYPDTGYRILALYRYWNNIQYWFPYKNLIDEDWKNVLEEFIPKVINAGDETEYTLTMLELIARVHDTHANIWGGNATLNSILGVNYAGVKTGYVENKFVVTGFYDERCRKESGLKIGDVISEVNGQTADTIIKNHLKITPASNYPTQLRDISRNLLRTNDTTIKVVITSENNRKNISLKAYPPAEIDIYGRLQKPDTSFKLITKDIAYINNGTLKRAHLTKIREEMRNTKGLIIDDRNYPSDFPIYNLGRYLMPDSTPFVKFTSGSLSSPGLFTFGNPLGVGYENKDYYRGKVVILVNEISQSSAEFHAMAYRVAPGATVIGSTTAGADGNVSQFSLPGGISTMISGIGVYYPGGGETQRVGIVPDLEVKPTIKGIISGKDEVLEKAIEIINGK